MLKLISGENVIQPNGEVYKRVVLLSEDEPSNLSITGADVDGMADGEVIAVGSVLITPEANYIAFADGEFTKKE